MRQLQLVAHGEPSHVIELHTVSEPTLGQEDVLVSMEAAPLNPSDFLLVRGLYGVRPAFPFSPKDFICRDLSLHGFWLANWIRNAPRTEIQEIYQKLGDLVADGSLSAAVEHVYPLEQFKEAFERSLKSNRSGKILFKLGAHGSI